MAKFMWARARLLKRTSYATLDCDRTSSDYEDDPQAVWMPIEFVDEDGYITCAVLGSDEIYYPCQFEIGQECKM